MSEVSGKKVKKSATRDADEARTLFAHLLLAGKNASLYPEGHSIPLNSIQQFYQRLEAFLSRHGEFRIEIEKDRVTSQGEDVYSGPFEEGTLTFTLFRDGIKWMEFYAGIAEEEVWELLTILNRYKSLSAEPDGDFATELWEKRFAHISYEAADVFFGDGIAQADGIRQFGRGVRREDLSRRELPEVERKDTIQSADLILTPEEEASLQAMVLLEETADASSHLFMLLDSLLLYNDEDSFRTVLDVLAEEFKNFMESRDLQACLIILEGVRHILESGRIGAAWAGALLEGFLLKISDEEHLEPLADIWLDMQVRQVGILERILQRLHPLAARRVALLLLIQKPPQLQAIVEEALIAYVGRDGDCLNPVVHAADEKMAGRLIPILGKIDTDIATKYLLHLVRHPSGSVRKLAVKAIADGRKFPAAEIFVLIDDPDEDVRRLILRQLSRERDTVAEYLLLRYLETNKFSADQGGHVLECFKALGKCGSLRSVPYLGKILFSRKWLSSFSQSPFQKGAALALAALKIPESDEVLENARHSIHLGLRRLVREACRDEAGRRRERR